MEEFLLYYNVIYFLFFTLVSIYVINISGTYSDIKVNNYDSIITFLFLILIALYFGFRNYEIGTDTVNYIRDFRFIQQQTSISGALDTVRKGDDPIFTIITFYFSRVLSEEMYLFSLVCLFLIPVSLFIFKLTNNQRSLVLLAFLSLYSFKYMAINTVRSGIGLAVALVGMYMFYFRKRYVSFLIVFTLSAFIHVSSLIFILSSIVVKYVKNIKLYVVFIFITSVLAYAGIGVKSIPYLGEILMEGDRSASYLSSESSYQTGFSITYWLYNFVVFLYALYFCNIIKDDFYYYLTRLFIFLTGIYYMSFEISFNDRIGVYSWILIPVIITYPFIKFNIFGKFRGGIVLLLLLLFQLLAVFYLNR